MRAAVLTVSDGVFHGAREDASGAVLAGRRVKYVMMNAPADALATIESILPGLESPSVIPLAHPGMHAVHAVEGSAEIAALLPRLKAAGASGILVMPVEKLLP